MPLNVPLALYIARCASTAAASSAMKPYQVRPSSFLYSQ